MYFDHVHPTTFFFLFFPLNKLPHNPPFIIMFYYYYYYQLLSLDSAYEWNQMTFVLLSLADFLSMISMLLMFLNSGHWACQTSTLPLEPCPKPSYIGLFFRKRLTFAWGHLCPWFSYLCLLSIWDYWHEPLYPTTHMFSMYLLSTKYWKEWYKMKEKHRFSISICNYIKSSPFNFLSAF
jgi:hypothetical protein